VSDRSEGGSEKAKKKKKKKDKGNKEKEPASDVPARPLSSPDSAELRQQIEVFALPLFSFPFLFLSFFFWLGPHRAPQENEILEKCIYCADPTKFFTYEVSLPMASSMDLNLSGPGTAAHLLALRHARHSHDTHDTRPTTRHSHDTHDTQRRQQPK